MAYTGAAPIGLMGEDNPALLLFIGEFWTDLSPEMRSVLIKTTNLTPDEAERLVSETNERNRLAVIRLSGRVE